MIVVVNSEGPVPKEVSKSSNIIIYRSRELLYITKKSFSCYMSLISFSVIKDVFIIYHLGGQNSPYNVFFKQLETSFTMSKR